MLKNGLEFKKKVFYDQSSVDTARARIPDVDLDYILESKIVLAVEQENINLTNCMIFLKGTKKKYN